METNILAAIAALINERGYADSKIVIMGASYDGDNKSAEVIVTVEGEDAEGVTGIRDFVLTIKELES